MKRAKFWIFLQENVLSLLSISIGATVLFLQGIGILNNIQIIGNSILAILISLATAQIVEQNKKLNNIETVIKNETKHIIDSLQNTDTIEFLNPSIGFSYIASKLTSIDSSICHLALGRFVPRWDESYKIFRDTRNDLLINNNVNYSYITLIDPNKIESTISSLKRLKSWIYNEEFHRLNIGIFILPRESPNSGFPFTNIMIFDSREVFAFYPGEPGEPEKTYSIKDPIIVKMYVNYFRRAWSRAILLDEIKVNELINQFERKHN